MEGRYMKIKSAQNLILGVFLALSLACDKGGPRLEHSDFDTLKKGDIITLYIAKNIRTMEAAMPEAKAVAVSGKRIVAVFDEESLNANFPDWHTTDTSTWSNHQVVINKEKFIDKIIYPGFIDPHLHPSLPALLLQFPFIAPDCWDLPTGFFEAAKTPKGYQNKLKIHYDTYVSKMTESNPFPFITWGFHELWHLSKKSGEKTPMEIMNSVDIKKIGVILWQRSFHVVYANEVAVKYFGIQKEDFKNISEEDWKAGKFAEENFMTFLLKMKGKMDPKKYEEGLVNFYKMAHMGGVTSIMDMGTGMTAPIPEEQKQLLDIAESNSVASRIILTPYAPLFMDAGVPPEKALRRVNRWTKEQDKSKSVLLDNHFKLMIDGAIFAGLSQFDYPGYIDSHKGRWFTNPIDAIYPYAKTFWEAGYQIHVHTNGDASAALLIEIVQKLQKEHPRIDHRLTLEHFAYAAEDQVQEMKELGMAISANPYYVYMLSGVYTKQNWLDPARADNMVPLSYVKNAGIRFALHSDCPMAPLSPLTLVWSAVKRQGIDGNIHGKTQRISIEEAMRAVTIDAAWMMRWEDRVGSIRAGKYADFTVLNEDPIELYYKKKVDYIPEIKIWGTIFEGEIKEITDRKNGNKKCKL